MNEHYRKLIAQEFQNCVNGTIMRVNSKKSELRPFHTALLSEEVLFWSAFERSFSTSFGQRVIEEVARLVALSNGADEASRQRETYIEIDAVYETEIRHHMQGVRNHVKVEVLDHTLSDILSKNKSGKTEKIRIISDLWWRKDGIDNYISLKTVKPNIDQAVVAKEDCLHLRIANPNCNAYFGLPYNPFGERKEEYAFNPPMNIFDFHNDPVVLIGRDMWDTIGGAGCYDELLKIASEVGEKTKKEISALYNK